MSTYLLLRLEGPLMSFGDVAVDELRPTSLFPTQSMLTGLLANALGWHYCEFERHQSLQRRLRFGARLDRPGQELEDYQTVCISKEDRLWLSGGQGLLQRKGGEIKGPVIRHRYYRADGRVTVALTLGPPGESPTLDEVARALEWPARALYLGRACCPPAGPLFRGERVEAASPLAALALAAWMGSPDQGPPPEGLAAQVPWEDIQGPEKPAWSARPRYDLRDWRNQIHVDRRLVAECLVRPPQPSPEMKP